MCGICGIIDFKGRKVDESALRRMCSSLSHRGPDDEGTHFKNDPSCCVALGHRRLSIIDLSSAGHQPMSNEDGSLWIVFNGEIYNYRQLRSDLSGKHDFRSNTDTETLLHLYEEHGSQCLRYLKGMFAFAIWDSKNNVLFAARDRVGKKPFVYHCKGGRFAFSSELASLSESGVFEKRMNNKALDFYLSYGYVPAPLTIYQDVFKLPPAHMMTVKNGNVSIERYWSLNHADKMKISEHEAADELLRLLNEAVRSRLYSDVPLGAFLSGGIDSSVIVALMSRMSGNKVKTFSIGFPDKEYDESAHARRVAEMYSTEHHEFVVRPNALEVLPLLVERYGEPYAESSAIPTYYVSRETRKFVTVALNGDGGDESFAGYERYQAMGIAERLNRLPPFLGDFIERCSSLLPDSVNHKDTLRRIRRFFEASRMPKLSRYLRWVGIMDFGLKDLLYTQEMKELRSGFDPLEVISPFLGDRSLGLTDALLLTDVMTYLPDDLLVKVDIASMANSLEARSPFLDHEVMEFAARLPQEYKLKGTVKKYILKKAISGIVPKENVLRKKMGFGVPVGKWFRSDLKELLLDTLLSSTCLKRGYFKPQAVKDLIEEHVSCRRDHTFHLWSLLMLELWQKRFMD